jgi:hypothetical protein
MNYINHNITGMVDFAPSSVGPISNLDGGRHRRTTHTIVEPEELPASDRQER